MSQSSLSSDAKLAVQRYFLGLLAPTGFVSAVLGAVLGFGMNDWAKSRAAQNAMSDLVAPLTEAHAAVARAALEAEAAKLRSEAAEATATDVLARARAVQSEAERVRRELAARESELAELLKSERGFQALLEVVENNEELSRGMTSLLEPRIAELRASAEDLERRVDRLATGSEGRLEWQPVTWEGELVDGGARMIASGVVPRGGLLALGSSGKIRSYAAQLSVGGRVFCVEGYNSVTIPVSAGDPWNLSVWRVNFGTGGPRHTDPDPDEAQRALRFALGSSVDS